MIEKQEIVAKVRAISKILDLDCENWPDDILNDIIVANSRTTFENSPTETWTEEESQSMVEIKSPPVLNRFSVAPSRLSIGTRLCLGMKQYAFMDNKK